MTLGSLFFKENSPGDQYIKTHPEVGVEGGHSFE